jgi:hypothetical protein
MGLRHFFVPIPGLPPNQPDPTGRMGPSPWSEGCAAIWQKGEQKDNERLSGKARLGVTVLACPIPIFLNINKK